MDIRKLVQRSPFLDQLLAVEMPAWAVLMDHVEETGRPAEVWLEVADELAETTWLQNHGDRAHTLAYRLMFRGIAAASYPYALDLFRSYLGNNLHIGFDTSLARAAADGMNIARCGENWEQALRRDQVEWVIREQGNMERKPLTYREMRPVEPEQGEGITRRDADELLDPMRVVGQDYIPHVEVVVDEQAYVTVGDERRHSLWYSFAPEWLEHDLRRVHEAGPSSPSREFMTLVTDGGGYQDVMPEFILVGGGEVWQRVADPTHSGETECPLHDWDEENRTDAQDRVVTLTDTFCGERPGERCRYCEERVSQPHGYLSIGEGAESVYMRLEEPEEEDEDDE